MGSNSIVDTIQACSTYYSTIIAISFPKDTDDTTVWLTMHLDNGRQT